VLGRFGLWKGLGLTVKRLLACHPWGGSGVGGSGVDFQGESVRVNPEAAVHQSISQGSPQGSVQGEWVQKKKRD
jgi:putative component of membrane protein insertase Oxa1/YidC/SpoIIIJ protein YidD